VDTCVSHGSRGDHAIHAYADFDDYRGERLDTLAGLEQRCGASRVAYAGRVTCMCPYKSPSRVG
jgi:hypothetical protein